VTLLAYSRPFWPLFLHVLGAMTLFGAVLAATVAALARRPRTTFAALLVAVPAYVLMRGAAEWIYSKEGWSGDNDPTWLQLGFNIADGGLILLLLTIGVGYWWRRSGKPLAGRIVLALSGIYLVLLGVAWLAMSGKWG